MHSFRLLGLLLLIALLAACQPSVVLPGNSTRCENGRCYFAFQDNKDLSVRIDTIDGDNTTAEFLVEKSGTQRLFTYTFVQNERANIADDEYQERLRFTVNPGLEDFTLSFPVDQDSMPVFIEPSCFCLPEIWRIESGSISGEKRNDDTWFISVDVAFKGFGDEPRTLAFSEKFDRITE